MIVNLFKFIIIAIKKFKSSGNFLKAKEKAQKIPQTKKL